MPVDAPTPPEGDEDQTHERHIASRAELLPEEQAAGSDDPQAQARAILQEAQERTEHPERDVSLPAGAESSLETEGD
ncbi:MAG: hypothetical protein ABIP19_15395 [Dermatophilaceae bacterium]